MIWYGTHRLPMTRTLANVACTETAPSTLIRESDHNVERAARAQAIMHSMGVRHACRDSGRPVAREAEEQTRELFANILRPSQLNPKGQQFLRLCRSRGPQLLLPILPASCFRRSCLLACIFRHGRINLMMSRYAMNSTPNCRTNGSSVIFIAASHAISVM